METLRRTDTFSVSGDGFCSSTDYQVLTILYQPIIGQGAFVLYLTLMNLMNRQDLVSEEFFHADLESMLGQRIDDIEKNRFKLEAIGLLITFFGNDSFMYQLRLPLSARNFINDGILGEYLIAAVTKARFKKLLKIFKVKPSNKKQKFNISKSFNEVFLNLDSTENEYEGNLLSTKTRSFAKLTNSNFDWRIFNDSIPKDIFDVEELTEAIKAKIEQLSYVYSLRELEMKEIFIKSLDNNNFVNIAALARNSRANYKKDPKDKPNEEIDNRTPITDNIVDYFKTMNPKDVLEELGDGLVSSADLHHVERLIDEVGLNSGVVNVLLGYLVKTKGNNLPGYAYIEKVGMGWKRDNIETVEMALDYIKHLESARERQKYKKSSKPDAKPDWLDEYLANFEGEGQ